MSLDVSEIRKRLNALTTAGHEYFDSLVEEVGPISHLYIDSPDRVWDRLDEGLRDTSAKLRAELLDPVRMISNCMAGSSLLIEADGRDLSHSAKSIRACLRLRRYSAWDTEVLHDEGTVLGVQQAGQSDEQWVEPLEARSIFSREVNKLQDLVDLLDVSANQTVGGVNLNPQVSAHQEPNTAFIMMMIDSARRELEDLYNVYKDCFSKFGISAIRADEIEHQETITEKTIEKIKRAEFLLADVSGERPNVYYEVGYAHALGRKVILYRSNETKLHFDLAGYNCPVYENLSSLRKLLIGRLEHMTNRKPTND